MRGWSAVPLSLLLACAPAASGPGSPGVEAAPTPAAGPAPEIRALPATPAGTPPQIVPPPAFNAAVAQGTRTTSGEPGPAYGQNWSHYTMELRVLPEAQRVEGTVTIRYENASPDVLNVLVLDMTQNFAAPGADRLEPVEVTSGVQLGRVAVNGHTLGLGIAGAASVGY